MSRSPACKLTNPSSTRRSSSSPGGASTRTSVDDLAAVAGVSKATIYKHWTSKEDVFLEAISRLKCDMPVFDSGHPRSDITEILRHLATSQKPEAFSKIWPRVLSYAENNPAFANAFRARIACGRRAQTNRLVGIPRSSAASCARGIDIDFAMDLLFGPVMYHRFMQPSFRTICPIASLILSGGSMLLAPHLWRTLEKRC